MHAMILQGNGKYYVSAVFGVFNRFTVKREDKIIYQEVQDPYWIVWNESKSRLIRWSSFNPNKRNLLPQILIVDTDQSNWKRNDEEGCVDFLNLELLDSFLDEGQQPEDILEKCRSMDAGYVYETYREIRTPKDIEDFLCVSEDLHDAHIIREERLDDGSLYIRFDGTWGCEIEIWFWDDLEYDSSSRDPQYSDPYWFDCTLLLQDGFVYLIDEENVTVDMIKKGYCYFKARHMKYHVIPD